MGSSRRRKARPPRRFHFEMEEDAEEARRRAEKEAIIKYAEFDHGSDDVVPAIPESQHEEEDRPKGRRLASKKKQRAAKAEEVDTGPIVCQRCSMEFTALNQLKHHLMDKHTALWTAEHPEGETDAAAIRTIFKRLKKLNCRDCGKELKSTTYYNFHIKWCGREDETMICPVCNKEKKSIWMYQHMRGHEKKEQAAERAKDAPQKAEEDLTGRRRSAAQKAMDNMHVLTEDLQETENDLPRRRSAKVDDDVYIKLEDEADDEDEDIAEEKFSKSYGGEDRRRSAGGSKPGVVPAVPDVFQEVLEIELARPVVQHFPHLLPWRSDWSPVPRREVARHLPVYQESVQFCVTRGRDKSSPKVLQWQEDYVDASQVTVYVGGPVWALAWCPVPHAAWRDVPGQVLAVAAHRDMDCLHKTTAPFPAPGLIQLYHLSALSTNMEMPAVRMVMGIAHDFGEVLCLCWCPHGGWQPPLSLTGDVELPRLGLLAAGCTDGTIRIFSVPHPERLRRGEGDSNFFRPSPVVTLRVRNPAETGCCTSVDWQKGGECQYVLGGFGNGQVCLWLVSTEVAEGGSQELQPFRCFWAHSRRVTGVAWCPSVPSAFATCSLDRNLKVWSVENTRLPYSMMLHNAPVSAFSAIHWSSPLWCGPVYSQDDVFCPGRNTCGYMESGTREGYFKRPVSAHNSAAWDVSFSKWLNLLASCDNTGLLAISRAPHLAGWEDVKNTISRRIILYRSVLHDTGLAGAEVNGEAEAGRAGRKGGGKTKAAPPRIWPLTYKSMAPSVTLEFVDKTMDTKEVKSDVNAIHKEMEEDVYDRFPMTALYRVAMNPNMGCCTWVASGGQAGLLRLHNLPGLLTPQAHSFFRQ